MAKSAEQRLAELHKDRKRLVRERMQRELGGARWQRMVRVLPVLFRRQGELRVHRLLQGREQVMEAFDPERAVFGADSALRLQFGRGFLAGNDLFAYVDGPDEIERIAALGLVEAEPHADTTLIRPWPGPPRLLACLRAEPVPHKILESGRRVVSDKRLMQEAIGLVGRRADLIAIVEQLLSKSPE